MQVVASCQLPVVSGECAPCARAATRQLRTAFTLTEVMFAVILLGIGFIMVAAMFPVAIQQNRTTSEQTAATQLARAAISNLQQVATDDTMPGQTQATPRMNSALWRAIEGSLINADDPRYAWTALYAREANAQFAQVFVFTLQARNRPVFETEDTLRPWDESETNRYPANLEPKPALVHVLSGFPVDQITIYDLPSDPSAPARVSAREASVEAAYVVIASGSERGRVLRVGRPVNRAEGVWELAPGSDLPDSIGSIPAKNPDETLPPPVEAYIIGRGYSRLSSKYVDPPTFEGAAMDVMMFTGFVRVRQ